jgi:hypothetical protein
MQQQQPKTQTQHNTAAVLPSTPTNFFNCTFIHSRLVLWNKHHQARLLSKIEEKNPGFHPTALSNGQKPTPPVAREMGLQIEPVDDRWGSE